MAKKVKNPKATLTKLTQSKTKSGANKASQDDIHPDARERFERAVDIAAVTKPMHRKP